MSADASFFNSRLCNSRKYCKRCRLDRRYREAVVKTFGDPSNPDFDCPYGITAKEFDEDHLPPVSEMAKSVAKAVAQTVIDAACGRKVTEVERRVMKRLAVCSKCDFLNAKSERCKKCGCYVRVKAKLAKQRCPIRKW